MEKKFVNQVIKWSDIAPHKIIAIYAGVGSGKNAFANDIATGKLAGMTKGKTTLLITSRRKKVDEILSDEEFIDLYSSYISDNGNVKLSRDDFILYAKYRALSKKNMRYYNEETDTLCMSVVCTPAKVEYFLRRLYSANKDLNIIFTLFDVIIIDECHSLIADASYQSAPFHIYQMIKQFMAIKTSAQMILMTGTPYPVNEELQKLCGKQLHIINLMEECHNVQPKEIRFIYSDSIYKEIEKFINEGKKVIYFHNRGNFFPKDICGETNIPSEVVATTFSDKDKRNKYDLDDHAGHLRMDATDDSLTRFNKLPDNEQFNISLLLTTSRYKEGINIYDDKIGYIFIDSHLPIDIIQMCGRIRTGNHIAYIVIDTYQFTRDLHVEEAILRDTINKIAECNEEIETLEDDKKQDYIDDIVNNDDIYSYVSFNYFTEKFEDYYLKLAFWSYKNKCLKEWRAATLKKNGYTKLISGCFDNSIVVDFDSREYLSKELFRKYKIKIYDKPKNKAKINLKEIPEEYKHSKKTVNTVVDNLKTIWHSSSNSISYYIHKYNFISNNKNIEVERSGKDQKYIFIRSK